MIDDPTPGSSPGTGRWQLLCLLAGFLSGCATEATRAAEPLTVSAASSLTFAFREIAPLFETRTGVPVVFNFGSTGRLALQIEQGAPVDVFAAAGARFIDSLAIANLIYPGTRRVFCIGDLVAWVKDDGQPLASLDDLAAPQVDEARDRHLIA